MAADPRTDDHPDRPDGPDGPDTPVHERWWWTGTFRGVLGAVVVGFQWPVLTAGEATALNWAVATVGAAVAAWGAWLVWSAWRRQADAV